MSTLFDLIRKICLRDPLNDPLLYILENNKEACMNSPVEDIILETISNNKDDMFIKIMKANSYLVQYFGLKTISKIIIFAKKINCHDIINDILSEIPLLKLSDNLLTDMFNIAIIDDNEIIFDYLLDRGIDIETRDLTFKSTPIMFAAQIGRIGMVKKLLEKGAIINYTDKSALGYALSPDIKFFKETENRYECAKLLIQGGADITKCLPNYEMYMIARYLKREIQLEKLILKYE